MKKNLLIVVLSIILFGACSNEEYDNIVDGKPSITKIYSSDLLLATEKGEGTEISTRGLDQNAGEFTDEYPYKYIYIHSADSKTREEGHKSLKIPLKDVIFCDGCQGIHLEMEVIDESAGGGYIIRTENTNGEQQSITLAEGEEVYFSTIESPKWEAKVEGQSPITESDVFIQDNAVNKELLRSANDYSKEELISLLSEGEPDIPMMRHCTAFRTYFMFTDLSSENRGSIADESEWHDIMGDGYGTGNFYIKLYLGPNFTSEYDVYSDDVTNHEDRGFYVTNQEKYQPLEYSFYSTTPGGGDRILFEGYGYETDEYNYLIAPLNTHIPASEFSVYAFIKYTPDPSQVTEEFLTSDEGAKWFQIQVEGMTLDTNYVHFIVMAIDIENLKTAFKTTSTETRAYKGFEEIKVKSVVKDFIK